MASASALLTPLLLDGTLVGAEGACGLTVVVLGAEDSLLEEVFLEATTLEELSFFFGLDRRAIARILVFICTLLRIFSNI